MSISSIGSNNNALSFLDLQSEKVDSRQAFRTSQDMVHLSNQAKQMSAEQDQKKEDEEKGDESVQVSSSTGRSSRVSGLQREDVAALYRTIDKLG